MFDSDSEVGGVIRQNWALFVAIGVLLGGAGFGYAYKHSVASRDRTAVASSAAASNQADANTVVLPTQPKRKTPQELALEQIAEHEAKVEANPEDKDTPAYLMAMGNLYRQKLVDYEKAAECYRRILVDHADWDNVRLVYMQLATCYERLEDNEAAKEVYEQMLDVFAEGTNEYEIAHAAVFR